MSAFTLEDLQRMFESCAGVEESVVLDESVQDVEFADLGYDSLAVLEFAGRVQREYGVPMPDDAPALMTTPRQAVEFISAQFAAHDERTAA